MAKVADQDQRKRPVEADPDAPPTDEELALAAELRDALGDPSRTSEDAGVLRALALAESPRELPEKRQSELVEAALTRFDAKRRERRGVVVRVMFGAAALVAAAAAVLVFVGRSPATPPALTHARSTQPLFNEPFDRGQASARADRIAAARASDLRENRFAEWGVR